MWFSGEHRVLGVELGVGLGSAVLVVGLSDLRGLSQLNRVYDSVIFVSIGKAQLYTGF